MKTNHNQYALRFVFLLVGCGFTALVGLLLTGSELPETSRNTFGSVLAADLLRANVYGLGLIIPWIVFRLWPQGEAARFWGGVFGAFALAGGQVLLGGNLLALDRSLPWPGLLVYLRPLASLLYALGAAYLLRRFFGRKAWQSSLGVAVGLGLLVSAGWPITGALGTGSELLLAGIEALSMGLLGCIWIACVFSSNQAGPARLSDRRMALAAGLVCAALAPGLFLVRGWSSQGSGIGLLAIFLGPAAGALYLSTRTEDEYNPLASLAFLSTALFLPLAFTKGAEGEWIPGGIPQATNTALLAGLLASLLLAAALLAIQRRLKPLTHRPLVAWAVCLGALAIVSGAFFVSGRPGLQPDTFFVVMTDQPDTLALASSGTALSRRAALYHTLTSRAEASQASLRAMLDARRVRYTPYYLVDGLEVEGSPALRSELARRPDVARILDSPYLRPQPPLTGLGTMAEERPKPVGTPWDIRAIQADLVWIKYGVKGARITVGAIGSGVDWTHPDLTAGYLGSEGQHDYTWFDPWEGTPAPLDTNGIGTHTLATVLAVAPEARWIACRSLGRDLGNLAYYLDCMQFMLAPFPPSGDPFHAGDPARGAQIVNAAWICPPREGCDAQTLEVAVQHLKDAGQMFITGADNEGPACGSILPPGTANAALTVGATDRNGQVANFSGRGPLKGARKPELVAPGVGIISALPNDRYAEFNGTSMAASHVVGAVALLWSADPSLVGDIDRTVQILTQTADPIAGQDPCGSGGAIPNNQSGYGVVNAYQAIKLVLEKP